MTLSRSLVTAALGVVALVAWPWAGVAAAQDRPAPVVEVALGTLIFADDAVVSEQMAGGAARWYVLPRIGVGPEVAYISSENHSHLMLTGNVTWDLLRPTAGRPRPVTPFAVAGGGVFQTRQRFPAGWFTSREGTFTAGGGVRARVGDRVTLGVEARVGWELHLRINGLVGLRIGS